MRRLSLVSLLTLASLLLAGCPYTCTSTEAGLSAGRTFSDQNVLGPGSTAWSINLKAHFDRDRR